MQPGMTLKPRISVGNYRSRSSLFTRNGRAGDACGHNTAQFPRICHENRRRVSAVGAGLVGRTARRLLPAEEGYRLTAVGRYIQSCPLAGGRRARALIQWVPRSGPTSAADPRRAAPGCMTALRRPVWSGERCQPARQYRPYRPPRHGTGRRSILRRAAERPVRIEHPPVPRGRPASI